MNDMQVTMEIINDFILDVDTEPYYTTDQQYVNYPSTFPVVDYQLQSTNTLNELVDKHRKNLGYLPLFDDSGEYNDNGWYEFHIRFNGYCDEMYFGVVVITNDIDHPNDDNETEYQIEIPLSLNYQLFKKVNNLVEEEYGQSVKQMLDECYKMYIAA